MSDEFLTVVSYRDAIVPAWIHQADDTQEGYNEDALREAFREGVDAAYNVECRHGEGTKREPLVVNHGDSEPPRNRTYRSEYVGGFHWNYDDGWYWTNPDNGDKDWDKWNWDGVSGQFEHNFPLTEVV